MPTGCMLCVCEAICVEEKGDSEILFLHDCLEYNHAHGKAGTSIRSTQSRRNERKDENRIQRKLEQKRKLHFYATGKHGRVRGPKYNAYRVPSLFPFAAVLHAHGRVTNHRDGWRLWCFPSQTSCASNLAVNVLVPSGVFSKVSFFATTVSFSLSRSSCVIAVLAVLASVRLLYRKRRDLRPRKLCRPP